MFFWIFTFRCPSLRRVGKLHQRQKPRSQHHHDPVSVRDQTAQEFRVRVGRDPGVDDRFIHRDIFYCQKAYERCTAHGYAIHHINFIDAFIFQIFCRIMRILFQGNKFRFLFVVTICDHEVDMIVFRQLPCRRLKDPPGFRCALKHHEIFLIFISKFIDFHETGNILSLTSQHLYLTVSYA